MVLSDALSGFYIYCSFHHYEEVNLPRHNTCLKSQNKIMAISNHFASF